MLYPGWTTVGVFRCVLDRTTSMKSLAVGTVSIFLKLYTWRAKKEE
jgi:hypothetical protein